MTRHRPKRRNGSVTSPSKDRSISDSVERILIQAAGTGSQIARKVIRRPARFIRRQLLPALLPPASGERDLACGDVRVVGLLSSASGLGKSGRLCADVLASSGRTVSTADVSSLFASGDGIAAGGQGSAPFRSGVSIYHLNPSMLLPGILWSGLGAYYRSYNIGYWAWELESLPREWVESIRFVQAIIVPSVFCQRAVQQYTSKPVLVVPHPVTAPAAEPRETRSARFRVLNIFRFGSSFERKNPIGLVHAFRLAFGGDPDAELVLKTSYGCKFPRDYTRLLAAVGDATNIRLIDEVWEEERLWGLTRSADVYASLHRSEGFGLPLAEAIMAETAVLATNWSGNVDFCLPGEVYTIDYDLVACRDDHPEYDQVIDAKWAEPSIPHAAAQLRFVRSDAHAPDRARRAKQSLTRHLTKFGYAQALRTIAGEVETAPLGAPSPAIVRHR